MVKTKGWVSYFESRKHNCMRLAHIRHCLPGWSCHNDLTLGFLLTLDCDQSMLQIGGDDVAKTIFITFFIWGNAFPVSADTAEVVAQSQQPGDAAVEVGNTPINGIQHSLAGQGSFVARR